MPNIVDFDDGTITDIKDIIVYPKGWVNPLNVEYGIGLYYGTTPSFFWRVRGTKHTFVIPISRLYFLSKGENYRSHFEQILEGFREDYLEWGSNNFNYLWQKEYQEEFKKYII